MKTAIDYSQVTDDQVLEHDGLVHWYIRRDWACRRAIDRCILETDDLVSAGRMGVARALATHDAERSKFGGWATQQIRASINELFRTTKWKHASWVEVKPDPLIGAARQADARDETVTLDPGPAGDEFDPLGVASSGELYGLARGLLADLPDQQRQVVEMRVLRGQTGVEVAQALGVSTARVSYVLHRALESMRAKAHHRSKQGRATAERAA